MTYTPKPKDMTKFLVDITSKDALHTWGHPNDSPVRGLGMSAGVGVTIAQRKLREQRRKTVGAYNTSHLANAVASQRGEISQFTKTQRSKITERMTRQQDKEVQSSAHITPSPAKTPLSARPIPDATLYQRRPF